MMNLKHKFLVGLSIVLCCSIFVSVVTAQSWGVGVNWVVGSNWKAVTVTPTPTLSPTPKPTVAPTPVVTPRPQTSTSLKIDTNCVLTSVLFDQKTLNFTSSSSGTIKASIHKNTLSSLTNFVVYVNAIKYSYTYSSSNTLWILTVIVK
jgi:hypothetical protein